MLARAAARAARTSRGASLSSLGACPRASISGAQWARFASGDAPISALGSAASAASSATDLNDEPAVAGRDPEGLIARASELVDQASSTWQSVLAASPDVEVITAQVAPVLEGTGFNATLAQLLDAAHSATGQPWWVVITGAVIAVRLVAMPVSIHGMAAGSRLKSVTPFMALYRKQQMEAAKRKDQQAMVAAAQQIKSLQKQFGASPLTLFFPVIFQAAMGIWLFTTLRKMGLEADQIPGFVSEGLPWVPDLGATEYTLPAIVTISGLLTAQVSRTIAPTTANAGPMSPDFMLNMSRFFAVFGGAIMTTLPAAVSLSAAVTSMSVMANLTMVRLPAVQKAFGFAKGWPDVEHVVPKGWDKESAARLAAEHAAEESKKNPFAALQNGAADASGDKGEKSAVSFSGVREVAAPPPPEEAKAAGSGAAAATGAAAAASTAAPGTQTTPSGQVLYKARGHKAKKPPAGKPKGKRAGRRK